MRVARVTVRSAVAGSPAPLVGLEQFDVAPVGEALYAFADGWWEPEEDPRRGVSWRWSSDRSTLVVQEPSSDLRLTLAGESPLKNFDRAPVVIVRAGELELGRFSPSADFTQTIDVPQKAIVAAGGRVIIETDLSFVPRERGANQDPRRLGLRFYRVEIDRRCKRARHTALHDTRESIRLRRIVPAAAFVGRDVNAR